MIQLLLYWISSTLYPGHWTLTIILFLQNNESSPLEKCFFVNSTFFSGLNQYEIVIWRNDCPGDGLKLSRTGAFSNHTLCDRRMGKIWVEPNNIHLQSPTWKTLWIYMRKHIMKGRVQWLDFFIQIFVALVLS